jgi:hypothetical protein
MGNGEVIGNGSVHWTIQHDDKPGGKRLKARAEGNVDHDVLGDDEVNVYDGARGCDPIAADAVGGAKGHRGKFRVTLRFKTRVEAEAAVKQATQIANAPGGGFEILLDVPVHTPHRTKDDAKNRRPPAEVRVDW